MKVTIYTIPNCPFCQQAKDFMNSKSVAFVEKDVQSDKDALAEMLSASNKFAGVPCAVVENDGADTVVLKGFDQSEYEKALGVTGGAPVPVEPALSSEPLTAGVSDMSMGSTDSMAQSGMPGVPAAPMPNDQNPLSGVPTPPTPPAPMDASSTMGSFDPLKPSMNQTSDASLNSMPAGAGMPQAPPGDLSGTPGIQVTQSGMPSSMGSLGGPLDSMQAPTPPAAVSTPPDLGLPSAGGVPPVSATPEPTDPQAELSGLLKDLESKVAGATATPSASPQSGMPSNGFGGNLNNTMPSSPASTAGATAPGPVTSADLPDFTQTK